MTPRTSGSGESSMTASTFSTITTTFQAVNFSPGPGSSHKISANQAQLPETDSYQPTSPSAGSRPSGNYNQIADQNNFTHAAPPQFDEVYSEGGNAQCGNYTTTPQLPPLGFREERIRQALSPHPTIWTTPPFGPPRIFLPLYKQHLMTLQRFNFYTIFCSFRISC
ncbi:hypothetical protein BKA61DRAFT_359407 [Leptodontidium sp. MPI-SDFR-AT-0119]|nr:hypothetical protein BKA61DRAFT_359407 [Leptodontidium sp. MPI-SDFR-AT-0119]